MSIQDLLHIDKSIAHWIALYGPWFYGVMFLILFAETGLVVTPFLPGDTLLFAAGLFCDPSKNALELWKVLAILTVAPILGDTVNYHVGKFLGPKIFHTENSRIFKKHHLQTTHEFFEKYGAKTVMLARWIPIVRTFAPFVAGLSEMPFRRFIGWSSLGALIWVWVCTLAGYFFGKLPWVQKNFEFAMLAMLLITATPVALEGLKARKKSKISAELKAAQLSELSEG